MQMPGHAIAIIHRVIIPEQWLAPQQLADTFEMARRNFTGTDLFPGPENSHFTVQFRPQGFQIVRRPLPEHPVQHRVIGVVGGAYAKFAGTGVGFYPVHDLSLGAGQVRGVRVHVIKQDSQLLDTEAIQHFQFLRQGLPGRLIEVIEDFERAQPNTKPHTFTPAESGKVRHCLSLLRRVRLLPATTQVRIGLGGIQIEAVTMGKQGIDQLAPFGPAPQGAVKSFNNSQFHRHKPVAPCLPPKRVLYRTSRLDDGIVRSQQAYRMIRS